MSESSTSTTTATSYLSSADLLRRAEGVASDTPYITLGGDAVAALLKRFADIHTAVALLDEAGIINATLTLSAIDPLNEIAERVLGLVES